MRTFYSIATLLFVGFLTQSCHTQIDEPKLQHGDLLFQDLNCGDLCDAIETVTYGINKKDFSHCAMVVNINDSLMVVEAIGQNVRITSVKDFYERSGDTLEINNITVARLKPEYIELVEQASVFALEQVGQPYDQPFLLENGKWYCSELLYESYKHANNGRAFFELSPMTFKDPKTNDFFPAWVTYYEELGQPIPEGELGLNPGSISRSDKIKVID